MRPISTYIFSLFVIITILFVGCSDSENNPTSNNEPEEETPENILKGTWKLSHTGVNDKTGGIDTLRVTLNIDGSDNEIGGEAYFYYSHTDTSGRFSSENTPDDDPREITGWYNQDSISVFDYPDFGFKGEKVGADYTGQTVYVTLGFSIPKDTIIVNGTFIRDN